MQTQRVIFTGAVLARLYATCSEAKDAFDGLLFGCSTTHAKDVYSDDQEAVNFEETVLMVTNAITSISICSFYDGAGKLNSPTCDVREEAEWYEELLQMSEMSRDPLIGWCIFQAEPSDGPTTMMRNVTHTLVQQSTRRLSASPQIPNLLCLLRTSKLHNDATVSLHYNAYLSVDGKAHPDTDRDVISGRALIPVPVETLNAGDQRGQDRYTSLWPSSFNFLASNLDETEAMTMITQAEGIEMESQRQLVGELRRRCQDLLKEYERNVAEVRSGLSQIHKRQEELEHLKALCQQTNSRR